jgi:SAM-dependent methyltransferase
MDIKTRQQIEIDYWRDSVHESPESDSIHNITNKMSDAVVFLDCIQRFVGASDADGTVLELGGGQGWASCIYKRLFPTSRVTTTDISEFAIRSVVKWERLLSVTVDRAYHCTSYETQESDSSVDLVFAFAAAHHFVRHKSTLREISRILKPGGRALYLYEPATPKYLYSAAVRRVNRNRPEVPEDVLSTAHLLELASNEGLQGRVSYYPSMLKRAPMETIYYSLLRRLPFLQRALPCTANFVFEKPTNDGRSPTRTRQ